MPPLSRPWMWMWCCERESVPGRQRWIRCQTGWKLTCHDSHEDNLYWGFSQVIPIWGSHECFLEEVAFGQNALIGRIRLWMDKRKALWVKSGNEERKSLSSLHQPRASLEEEWFHRKNYGWMVGLLKGWEVKKQSQGICDEGNHTRGHYGKNGSVHFFFFTHLQPITVFISTDNYVKEMKGQITCSWKSSVAH